MLAIIRKSALSFVLLHTSVALFAEDMRDRPFDDEWRFLRGEAQGAEIPLHFSVTGAGELAGQASAVPNEPASFKTPSRKTFQGRCLAILRPIGGASEISLRAEAEGFEPANVTIYAK